MLVAAVLTSRSGEAVCEDSALQVGSEVLLHPERDAVAHGVGLGGLGEEGLEMMLDHGVERRGCGPALPVDGPGHGPVGYLGRRPRNGAPALCFFSIRVLRVFCHWFRRTWSSRGNRLSRWTKCNRLRAGSKCGDAVWELAPHFVAPFVATLRRHTLSPTA